MIRYPYFLFILLLIIVCRTRADDVESPLESKSASRRLLSKEDFTYLGAHKTAQYKGGPNSLDIFSEGLTHRYVNGELRFMFASFQGNREAERFKLKEIKLNELGTPPTTVGVYSDMWVGWNDNATHKSIWWDEENGIVWSGSGFDYPQAGISNNGTPAIYGREPPSESGQPCTNHTGWFGIEGIGQRAMWGKLNTIPKWFRQRESLPKYIVLGGGYTSKMAQGLGPSMGPMFVAVPDMLQYEGVPLYTDNFNIPASDAKILADHRLGASKGKDWYADGYENRTYDRGVRLTLIDNYFDKGDPRKNPQSRPEFPPVEGAQWLSPAPGDPDRWGRWVWGDSYGGSGLWIDNDAGTRMRHGIVTAFRGSAGACWYQSSSGRSDGTCAELHIFDPEDLALVNQGKASPNLVRPKSIIDLTDLLTPGYTKNSSIAATFDSHSSILYILVYKLDGKDASGSPLNAHNLILMFKVRGGA